MRARVIAIVLLLVVLAAACGNSGDDGKSSAGDTTTTSDGGSTTAVDQPGVSATEIRIGGVASQTNPLGAQYGNAFKGVQAYVEMVNSEGGIYGRKLNFASKRDDQLANNKAEVQALLTQDNVFAALPIATLLFTGAPLLADAKIPTFGWNVQKEWTGPPNLFEQEGALGFDQAGQGLPWLAKKLGKKKVAVLAYSVPQSADCANGAKNSFDKFPTAELAFVDKSLSYGNLDYSTDVKKMKDAGIDLVTTCMDQNGVLNLQREMKKQGLNAIQFMPNAYDHDFMDKYGDLFEGSYVRTRFAPFEARPESEGMKEYHKWMDKIGEPETELSLVGWIDADMFVTGLKAAGKDFTRQKVIDALNEMKDYDAKGILPGLDWTIQHNDPRDAKYDPAEDCFSVTQVKAKKFVPVFGSPGKPFICFETKATTVPDDPKVKA